MNGTPDASTQSNLTPAEIADWLRDGNARFAAGLSRNRDLLAQARATVDAQFPLAAVLGCIDSRVPVETIFDLGLGDVFVGRTAGAVINDDVIGGFEFATELAGARLIAVLGHTGCGAVKGACDGVELGHLTQLLAKITPAITQVAGGHPAPDCDDPRFVDRVIEQNVRNSVAALLASDVLAARVADGTLAVVGAVYDLASGTVRWLDD